MAEGKYQAILDALALASSPIPVAGDVVGAAADGYRYWNQPEERTPGNFALSAAGLLPFIPAVGSLKSVGTKAYHATTAKEFEKFSEKMIGSVNGKKLQDQGFWFSSDPFQAKVYATGDPRTRAQVRVLEALLDMQNPAVWDKSLKGAFIEKARKAGHDGVIFKDIDDGTGIIADQYLMFSPDKINIIKQK